MSQMSKKWFGLCFVLILLVAVAIRFYKLGSVPYSLYWDEAAMQVDVKSVVQTGHDMFGRPWYQVIYPSYGDFKLPVYIWAASGVAKVIGVSEFAFRLPSALAGIGTIIVAGWLAKEFLEDGRSAKKSSLKSVQLWTMLIVAVVPWAIMFSRTGFEGHVGQFLLACSMLCVVLARKKPWLIFLSPLIGALAVYTYFSVRFVWPPIFLEAVALIFWKEIWQNVQKKKWKKTVWLLLKFAVLPLVLFSVLLVPMLKSPLYNDMNRFRLGTDSVLNEPNYALQVNSYRELGGNTKLDRIMFNQPILIGRELLRNYSANLSADFLFFTGDPNLRHGTQHAGLFYLIFLPFLLFGIYFLFTRKRGVFFLLISWWLLALLPASVPNNVPHALRALNALVPIAVIMGVGITFCIEKTHRLFALLIVICIALSTITFLFHYFVFYPSESAKDWQDGYKQLAQAIYARKKTNEEVHILSFDDRFYLWLMAYGPDTGKDFQSWKSVNYHFDNFDNITTQDVDLKALVKPTHPFLIAGEPDRVQQELKNVVQKPDWQTDVLGSDGMLRYVLEEFGK